MFGSLRPQLEQNSLSHESIVLLVRRCNVICHFVAPDREQRQPVSDAKTQRHFLIVTLNMTYALWMTTIKTLVLRQSVAQGTLDTHDPE